MPFSPARLGCWIAMAKNWPACAWTASNAAMPGCGCPRCRPPSPKPCSLRKTGGSILTAVWTYSPWPQHSKTQPGAMACAAPARSRCNWRRSSTKACKPKKVHAACCKSSSKCVRLGPWSASTARPRSSRPISTPSPSAASCKDWPVPRMRCSTKRRMAWMRTSRPCWWPCCARRKPAPNA
jgi:hypothetical protein